MRASIVVPLTGAPARALATLEALAALDEEVRHEVILVDDGSVGLDELLARVEGDVAIVRTGYRAGLAGAWRAGLTRATGDDVLLLVEGARPAPDALAHLAGGPLTPEGPPAVAAPALAAPRGRLATIPDAPDHLALAALALHLGAVAPRRGLRVHAPDARTAGTRGHVGAEVELSVVIPTLDAASDRTRACLAALQAHTDVPHELIVIDNGAPPQGYTLPVNAGLRAARGTHLVVCNDDVEVLPGWWEPLRDALDAGHPVAFPVTEQGANRHDFAAWCFALRRDALTLHGHADGEFLDPSLRIWFSDTALLDRLRAAGRPPIRVAGSRIRHGLSETVASADPELSRWIRTTIVEDERRYRAAASSLVA